MRLIAAAAIALALAACSGAPKKPGAPPATATPPVPDEGGRSAPRRSPYAPAQEDPSKRGDYVAGGLYAPHISDSAPDYIPDVDAIPEPEVVDEPRSRYGNRSPYQVLGRSYRVMDDPRGFNERGIASYYGDKFHGRRTSNMEVYDMYAFTAAHKSLPLPSFARVTNLDNGRSVVVRVNDRGPFHEGRVVDLSWAAAVKLDMHRQGTAQVEVQALSPGEDARHAHGAIAAREPAAGSEADSGAAQPSAIDALIDVLPVADAAAAPPAAGPLPEIAAGVDPEYAHGRRFSMMQGGRVMTADDFDAWLEERQIDLHAARTLAGSEDAVTVAPPAGGVTLQVAAFGARANAERALDMLRGAGIADARLVNGQAGGRAVWRLRVGPVAAGLVPELSARFAGLGFGQPQVVRD